LFEVFVASDNGKSHCCMIETPATQYDPALADFWVSAWQLAMPTIDFQKRRPWVLAHLAEMRATGQILRAYFDHGSPIGFYTLYPDIGLLEQICVSPSANGRGVGRALIDDATRHAQQNLRLVVNENNQSARAFYAKLGFVELGRSLNPVSRLPVVTLQMAAKSP
jgi:putative acetyltransferase